jgi:hypothetical protein
MDPYAATNRDRSEWATVALEAFAKATRMEPLEVNFYECICDLVANLGHLAEEHGRSGIFSAESRDPSGDPHMNDEVEIIVSPGPTECDV